MPVDWRQLLAFTLAGAGGQAGNLAAMQEQKKREQAQQQFGQQLAQAMLPQQDPRFPSPTGPGNPTPTMGQAPMDPNVIAAMLARAPQGFDASPLLGAFNLQQRTQSDQQDRAFRERQFGEQQRQFDIRSVDDATQGVENALERSLDRGYRANQDVNQRNFMREQNDLTRQSQMDIANIRAESQLGSASNVQSVQPVGDGTLIKIYRNGSVERVDMDGKPVMGARNDPNALFNQQAASSSGRAAGTQAEALPTIDANFKVINDTLASFDDPTVKAQAPRALGWGGFLPEIPGVNTDFIARTKQLQGQTFLQAYNTLKGGGQITEVEGEKATQSIARLNRSQTVSEFYGALANAKATFADLYKSARQRGERGAVVPQMRGGPQQQPQQSSGDPLAEARAAIARGAPRDKVIERLRQNGINPGGL